MQYGLAFKVAPLGISDLAPSVKWAGRTTKEKIMILRETRHRALIDVGGQWAWLHSVRTGGNQSLNICTPANRLRQYANKHYYTGQFKVTAQWVNTFLNVNDLELACQQRDYRQL
jgi:hypothetical protein